jgi:hypothetical protein
MRLFFRGSAFEGCHRGSNRNWRVLGCALAVVLVALAVQAAAVGRDLLVTSTSDDGAGSLRRALNYVLTGDRITFDPAAFPADSPATIRLATPLPAILQGGITVDGRGAGVVIDGGGMSEADGLAIRSSNNRIYGLTITGFLPGSGISIQNHARGNVIGGGQNADGRLVGANIVGGNEIGIAIGDGAQDNIVTGNYIGIHPDGVTPWQNESGVGFMSGATGNTIGPANMIAHNGIGVRAYSGCEGNTVTRNRMFGNVNGDIAWNDPACVAYAPPVVAGIDPFSRMLEGTACPDCLVEFFLSVPGVENEGAYVGNAVADSGGGFSTVLSDLSGWTCVAATATTTDGSTSRFSGPSCECVAAEPGASIDGPEPPSDVTCPGRDALVTSTADDGPGTLRRALQDALPGQRIVFDATAFPEDMPATIRLATPLPAILQGGITVDGRGAGVVIDGGGMSEADGLAIRSSNNRIYGLTITGFRPGSGISIQNRARGNVIGGGQDDEGHLSGANVVGGNEIGVAIGDGAQDNIVTGNYIGVRTDGITPWGNESGVGFMGGAVGNTIGPANVIAHNGYCVRTYGVGCGGNPVTKNRMFGNANADIIWDDPACVGHAPPVIVGIDPFSQTVVGTACPDCLLEFFLSAPGAENGGAYVGDAVADSRGNFSATLSGLSGWTCVAATSTSPDGATSRFSGSSCVWIGRDILVTSPADDGQGTLRRALQNARPGQRILFDATTFPEDSPVTIRLATPLPTLSQGGTTVDGRGAGVVIDGSEIPDGADGLVIQSDDNRIYGLAITGFHPGSGILIQNHARGNLIGGGQDADGQPIGANVVGGNEIGIAIGDEAQGNTVSGNYIGVRSDGVTKWSNDSGVVFSDRASGNTIGPANVIAHNGSGVRTYSGCGGNPVTKNRMFGNTQDITWDNPACVEHAPPVIAGIDPFSQTVTGMTCPGCRVKFFLSVAGARNTEDGVIDEGAWAFLRSVEGTDAEGACIGSTVADPRGSFSAVLDELPRWTCIAATATTPNGSTSRFSDSVCECLADKGPSPTSTQATPTAAGSHRIRVMTYNINFGGLMGLYRSDCPGAVGSKVNAECMDSLVGEFVQAGGFAGGTLGRLSWLVDIIRMADPDIVAIQEAWHWADYDGFIAREVARATGMNYCLNIGPDGTAAPGNIKLSVVLTKFEIRDTEWFRQLGTSVLRAELVTPEGLTLNVFSVHTGNPPPGGASSVTMARETRVLAAVMRPYRSGATILLGDMNTRLDEPKIQPIWDDGWVLVGSNIPDLIWVSPGFPLLQSTGDVASSVFCEYSHALGGRFSDYSDIMSDHYPVLVDVWTLP